MARDLTLGFGKANIYALGLMIPIGALYVLLYGGIHGTAAAGNDFSVFLGNGWFFLISVITGIVLHEAIHAVSWSWLDGIPWGKIHFGFKWKMLTPYVHCPEPVNVNHYRWGVAMPGLVLGIIPYLIALVFRIEWLYGFGFFFTIVAGGDFIMLWLLRDVEDGKLVQDHPDLIGCQVLNQSESGLES